MRLLLSLLLVLCVRGIVAQNFQAQVISGGGENFMTSQGSLEWTMGEIMIETYVKPAGFLTQGFQQPSKVTITEVENNADQNIVVYPNPVRELLQIRSNETGTFLIEVINLQGQKVVDETLQKGSADLVLEVNVRLLSPAIYLLRVTNASSGITRIQKIEKF